VEPCHDSVVDGPAERSGLAVVIDSGEIPLFLVRGIENVGLGPASILTAESERYSSFDGGSNYLRPGESLTLKLGRGEYRLTAHGKYDSTRPDSDRLVLGYRLALIGPDGQSQDLGAPARFAEDGVPVLLWAGDLDRDGKIDLYMDLTDHYNVRDYVLLLSSHASGGLLVKRVASRRYVGC